MLVTEPNINTPDCWPWLCSGDNGKMTNENLSRCGWADSSKRGETQLFNWFVKKGHVSCQTLEVTLGSLFLWRRVSTQTSSEQKRKNGSYFLTFLCDAVHKLMQVKNPTSRSTLLSEDSVESCCCCIRAPEESHGKLWHLHNQSICSNTVTVTA